MDETQRQARLARERQDALDQGVVTREQIEDNVFAKEELEALGWRRDPITDNWKAF